MTIYLDLSDPKKFDQFINKMESKVADSNYFNLKNFIDKHKEEELEEELDKELSALYEKLENDLDNYDEDADEEDIFSEFAAQEIEKQFGDKFDDLCIKSYAKEYVRNKKENLYDF